MMMQYHLGLAVGHTYAYGQISSITDEQGSQAAFTEDEEELESAPSRATVHIARSDCEHSFDSGDDTNGSEDGSEAPDDEYSCNEEFYAVDEMYSCN